MGVFQLSAILVTLAALLSFINWRYVRLPMTVGVMLLSLLASLIVLATGEWTPNLRHFAAMLVNGIDFDRVILHGMLAFLLFAGSLQVDMNDLAPEWLPVTLLAPLGTALSTLLVGTATYLMFRWIGEPVPLLPCMMFGALISPTDPVAVLSIMKRVRAPRRIETLVAAESLFNDGVAVVIFLSLLSLAAGERPLTATGVVTLFLQEAGGGLALGLVAGFVTYQFLRRVDNYQVEVLLTLALAMGGYALADALHCSAPIAAVVSGLFIGNHGRAFGMSKRTREHLDPFWELIDEILNVVLFMLVGLEVLAMTFVPHWRPAIAAAVVITLLARWLSVAPIMTLLRPRVPFPRGTIRILTWGGLRGGISVAMALALPATAHRPLLIAMTYGVVVFSILFQGVTIGRVVNRLQQSAQEKAAARA